MATLQSSYALSVIAVPTRGQRILKRDFSFSPSKESSSKNFTKWRRLSKISSETVKTCLMNVDPPGTVGFTSLTCTCEEFHQGLATSKHNRRGRGLRLRASDGGALPSFKPGGKTSSPAGSNADKIILEEDDSQYTITFRPATSADMPTIQRLVFSEYMNPLGLQCERFVVADGGPALGLLGAAQVKEWPTASGSSSGSVSGSDSGSGSSFAPPPLLELRSLVVLPRHRGKRVGSRLVEYLLNTLEGRGSLYILTIGRSISFYERLGFKEVTHAIPKQLQLEAWLGGIVARFAAQDRCLCMVVTI
eukprot:jgi/Mesen1/6584/ME000336S05802